MGLPEPVLKFEEQRALRRGAALQLSEFGRKAVEKLESEWEPSLQAIVNVRDDPESPASVRMQAAKFLMEHAADLKERMGGTLAEAVEGLSLPGSPQDLETIIQKVENDPELSSIVLRIHGNSESSPAESRRSPRGRKKGT